MAEIGSSSQESLPLSQETYSTLFRELGSIGNIMNDPLIMPMINGQDFSDLVNDMTRSQACTSSMMNDVKTEIHTAGELRRLEGLGSLEISNQYIHIPENPPEQKRPISSLPASEIWPGDFQFCISFTPQVTAKSISWIFSEEKKKLYVGKDVPCPINFSTSASMPEDVYIRAMALFSSSDHASEKVTRCVNHSVDELNKKVFEAEHLIRCNSNNATYYIDSVTGRHSVIVPFENPSAGQEYSTYLYKFMCYGSCSGGPNRRPLMVVFTLEQRGEVLGRQRIDLKVCACPARDFKSDGKQPLADVLKENKPLKRSAGQALLTSMPPAKKIRTTPEQSSNDYYIVKTRDKNCYAFLRKMKRLYDIHQAMDSKFPGLRRLIYTSSQSSSSEETEAS